MKEAQISDVSEFPNFNTFFVRALAPLARPIDSDADSVVSPADGVISQLGRIQNGLLVQAKGRDFKLVDLLGGSQVHAEKFMQGSFATVYLSPKDYHRVHMPVSGQLETMTYIPGKLFSVNQLTSESVPDLLARNERVVCLFTTEIGPMALVLVGAMIVASIDTVWAGEICPRSTKPATFDYQQQSPPIHIRKGEEMGRFKLGSTVIVLFGPGAIDLNPSLTAGSDIQMGQAIGKVKVLGSGC